jgi:hypothetical protein
MRQLIGEGRCRAAERASERRQVRKGSGSAPLAHPSAPPGKKLKTSRNWKFMIREEMSSDVNIAAPVFRLFTCQKAAAEAGVADSCRCSVPLRAVA